MNTGLEKLVKEISQTKTFIEKCSNSLVIKAKQKKHGSSWFKKIFLSLNNKSNSLTWMQKYLTYMLHVFQSFKNANDIPSSKNVV